MSISLFVVEFEGRAFQSLKGKIGTNRIRKYWL